MKAINIKSRITLYNKLGRTDLALERTAGLRYKSGRNNLGFSLLFGTLLFYTGSLFYLTTVGCHFLSARLSY
jgi:hypothetical protein